MGGRLDVGDCEELGLLLLAQDGQQTQPAGQDCLASVRQLHHTTHGARTRAIGKCRQLLVSTCEEEVMEEVMEAGPYGENVGKGKEDMSLGKEPVAHEASRE